MKPYRYLPDNTRQLSANTDYLMIQVTKTEYALVWHSIG